MKSLIAKTRIRCLALCAGLLSACAVSVVANASPSKTGGIDLNCEKHAESLIGQLASAGLLAEGAYPQARAISKQHCAAAQSTAQAQHEEGKKKAIENWFFESTGGKEGNKRLKRLKQ